MHHVRHMQKLLVAYLADDVLQIVSYVYWLIRYCLIQGHTDWDCKSFGDDNVHVNLHLLPGRCFASGIAFEASSRFYNKDRRGFHTGCTAAVAIHKQAVGFRK